MISIEEALKFVSSQSVNPTSERISILGSVGRVLFTDVVAPHDLPFFDNSAMDGYAVRGGGVSFKIVGEAAAGSGWSSDMNEGEAIRIFTGAMVPDGADYVIPQEKVTASNGVLTLSEIPEMGANIRRKGEELKAGDKVFEKGMRLNAAGVGLLASLGIADVDVVTKPRVALLVTGSELAEPGTSLLPGQIYESNSITLTSALSQSGLTPHRILKVKDSLEATSAAVNELLKESDVILISGGISVGDYDFVKDALQENGVTEIFYKVAQKPGKPLYFGRKDDRFVFALPGNPASALTCYYLYARLLLDRLMGLPERMPERKALLAPLPGNGDRPVIMRGVVEGDAVSPLNFQSSSMLHSFSYADALILPPGKAVAEGDSVRVVRI